MNLFLHGLTVIVYILVIFGYLAPLILSMSLIWGFIFVLIFISGFIKLIDDMKNKE